LLLLGLRDKQALVIPSGKPPELRKTPANPPMPQLQTFTTEGKLDAIGTYTAHVEQVYRGDVEVVLRAVFRQVSQSQWKEAAQRFSYQLGFGGEVSNVTVTPPEETGQPFHISYDYVRKNYSEWENQRITPPLPPMGIESNKDTKKPQESVLLGGLGEVVYRAKLTQPPGYTAVAPKSVDLNRSYLEYHATSSLENGTLTASRRLVIKQSEVALNDWEGYRDFGKAVSDDESTYIYLNGEGAGVSKAPPANTEELDNKFREGTEAERGRDFTRAEELFREVIAAHPKYQGAHFNLALALAAQNKMNDAIEEFHKEQEVSPNDVRVYELPARYLTFMRRGDEAMEEWRRLLKVDPKNRDAALNLSGLLTAVGKDEDAIAVLETSAKESPGSPSLEFALGEEYVKNGQADSGIAHLRKAMDSAADSRAIEPMMLNDAAYLLAERDTHVDVAKEYAEKAAAELDKRSVEAAGSDDTGLRMGPQFVALWDTLGWVYFQMGDAARAESFARAAWLLGQQGVAGDHLGQIYEKLGKKKEAEHVYEQALSAELIPPFVTSAAGPMAYQKAYQKGHDRILEHYEKLTGHKFSENLEVKRLPNGEWTKTPAEELRDSLVVKISKTTGVTGVAEFSVVLTPTAVESVRYRSGDGETQSRSLSDRAPGGQRSEARAAGAA